MSDNETTYVRHDVARFPKPLHDNLRGALAEALLKAGVDVTVRAATIRGVELAVEELRRAKPEQLRRIYSKGE